MGSGSCIKRIVSLVPSHTEILFFLGLGNRVVGVSLNCDFPEETNNIGKVGSFGQPQISEILAKNPDLVLADKILHKQVIERLKGFGIKVLAAAPSGLDDIFVVMTELGLICNHEAEVRTKVEALKLRVYSIEHSSINKKPRVMRLMNTNPFITPGPGSFQYDALRKAGARLMDFRSNDAYIKVNWHDIKEFDPEVILFCGVEKGHSPPPRCKGCTVKKPICQRTVEDIIAAGWEKLTAVHLNRVFPLSCHTICRPGPRLIDGMELLHNKLKMLFNQSF